MPFISPCFATPRTLKTNATENIKISEDITTNVWQTFQIKKLDANFFWTTFVLL
jgi:hypothetical protein